MDTNQLRTSALFRGMSEEEIKAALDTLSGGEKTYSKGSVILHAGDRARQMGMVLAGSVTIESNDIWGTRTILSYVGKGHFFAEAYAWLENEPLLVDAVANEDCRILFIRISDLNRRTPYNAWRSKLMQNLLTIAAHKNLVLSGRSFHVSSKTIRSRVMSYLNTISLQKGSREFDIPFDRQQLADYLSVERTALSKELGKMQKDGLIQYKLNHFVLHDRGSNDEVTF